MPEDPELQALYQEASKRGMFKQDTDMQAIGHELRRRGMVTDPTQGGLVTPGQPKDVTDNALYMEPKDVEQYLGVKYKFGGESTRQGIDCSAFVQQLYARNGVKGLQRTAEGQWSDKRGLRIPALQAIKAGDQLFFQGGRLGPGKASHTAYFAGWDRDASGRQIPMMYAASSAAGKVVKQRLDDFLAHSGQTFLGAKRYDEFQHTPHTQQAAQVTTTPTSTAKPSAKLPARGNIPESALLPGEPRHVSVGTRDKKVADYTESFLTPHRQFGLAGAHLPIDPKTGQPANEPAKLVARLAAHTPQERVKDPQFQALSPIGKQAVLKKWAQIDADPAVRQLKSGSVPTPNVVPPAGIQAVAHMKPGLLKQAAEFGVGLGDVQNLVAMGMMPQGMAGKAVGGAFATQMAFDAAKAAQQGEYLKSVLLLGTGGLAGAHAMSEGAGAAPKEERVMPPPKTRRQAMLEQPTLARTKGVTDATVQTGKIEGASPQTIRTGSGGQVGEGRGAGESARGEGQGRRVEEPARTRKAEAQVQPQAPQEVIPPEGRTAATTTVTLRSQKAADVVADRLRAQGNQVTVTRSGKEWVVTGSHKAAPPLSTPMKSATVPAEPPPPVPMRAIEPPKPARPGRKPATFGKQPEQITAAAVNVPNGMLTTGPNHPEILQRLGIRGYETAESRNTPMFGFVDASGNFLSREEAAVRAKQTGQDLKPFEAGEPAHSDEIAAPGTQTPISETKTVVPENIAQMTEDEFVHHATRTLQPGEKPLPADHPLRPALKDVYERFNAASRQYEEANPPPSYGGVTATNVRARKTSLEKWTEKKTQALRTVHEDIAREVYRERTATGTVPEGTRVTLPGKEGFHEGAGVVEAGGQTVRTDNGHSVPLTPEWKSAETAPKTEPAWRLPRERWTQLESLGKAESPQLVSSDAVQRLRQNKPGTVEIPLGDLLTGPVARKGLEPILALRVVKSSGDTAAYFKAGTASDEPFIAIGDKLLQKEPHEIYRALIHEGIHDARMTKGRDFSYEEPYQQRPQEQTAWAGMDRMLAAEYDAFHRQSVKDAIARGERVPPEVLAEYGIKGRGRKGFSIVGQETAPETPAATPPAEAPTKPVETPKPAEGGKTPAAAAEPVRPFTKEQGQAYQAEYDALRDKLFTKEGKPKQRVNPADQARFEELQGYAQQMAEYREAKAAWDADANRRATTARLAKQGIKEGDAVVYNHYGTEVRGPLVIDREGRAMVDQVSVSGDDLPMIRNATEKPTEPPARTGEAAFLAEMRQREQAAPLYAVEGVGEVRQNASPIDPRQYTITGEAAEVLKQETEAKGKHWNGARYRTEEQARKELDRVAGKMQRQANIAAAKAKTTKPRVPAGEKTSAAGLTKTQETFLLGRLAEVAKQEGGEKTVIKVPGDGQFTVTPGQAPKLAEAVKATRAEAPVRWPVKSPSAERVIAMYGGLDKAIDILKRQLERTEAADPKAQLGQARSMLSALENQRYQESPAGRYFKEVSGYAKRVAAGSTNARGEYTRQYAAYLWHNDPEMFPEPNAKMYKVGPQVGETIRESIQRLQRDYAPKVAPEPKPATPAEAKPAPKATFLPQRKAEAVLLENTNQAMLRIGKATSDTERRTVYEALSPEVQAKVRDRLTTTPTGEASPLPKWLQETEAKTAETPAQVVDRLNLESVMSEARRTATIASAERIASKLEAGQKPMPGDAPGLPPQEYTALVKALRERKAQTPAPPTRPAKPLQSTLLPGVNEWLEQDVLPTFRKLPGGLGRVAADIRAFLSPASGVPEAGQTARIIRENAADLARKTEQTRLALNTARKAFSDLLRERPVVVNKKIDASHPVFQFIDAIETGQTTGLNPEVQVIAQSLRSALDERVTQVQALGRLESVIQDYFPHIWKDPKQAEGFLANYYGKRPMEGGKAFLKKRTIPTTLEGIAAGLEPISFNPIDLTLLKTREMDRWIFAHRAFNEMKQAGIAKFVRALSTPPEGYRPLDDRIAQVQQIRPTVTKAGEEGAPELIQRGQWYAPADAARVFNNYLSPGLRGKPIYDALSATGNVLNQAQLGLSAFHLTFTTLDATISKVALGAEQISRGQVGRGTVSIAKGVTPLYAPIENFVRGNRVLREYIKPGSVGGDMAQIVDALQAGGGRVRMDQFYKNSSVEGFWRALERGNYPGAVLRAPFALLETAAKPLMEYIVPRQKLGVFADMARMELDALGPNATRDQVRTAMAKAWDSVDNRMGQLVYDNLFWHRTVKDLGLIGTRSLGWNLGTLRELGGASVDINPYALVKRAQAGQPLLTHRMAYAVALPMTVALYGAFMTYLYTGKGPTELLDYFQPPTGHTTKQGDKQRVQLPTYMRDIVPTVRAATEGFQSFVDRIREQASSKVHPLWQALNDMITNRNFFGDQIRNVDDPLMQQALQEAAFIASQFIPFGWRQPPGPQATTTGERVQRVIGIMPAPRTYQSGEKEYLEAMRKLKEMKQKGFKPAPRGGSSTPSDITKPEKGLFTEPSEFKPDRRSSVPPGDFTILRRAG